MGAPATPPSRRRAGAVIGAVLAVAVILGGAAVAGLGGPDRSRGPSEGEPAAPRTSPAPEPVLDLDAGELSDAEALAACSTEAFAAGRDVTVLYAVRQRTEAGHAPVVLLRNADGELRLCDATGPDAPAVLPVPEASDRSPVAFLGNGRAAWDCSGTTVDGYTATLWLAVGPQVDRVQQRYVVDGRPGPWFSTAARDGVAHLQTWLSGPLAQGAALAVQQRVLDEAGAPVAQDTLPTRRQPLAGCRDGDVQIG
ncbi:MAG: hypothetical protein ACTHKG_18510 [Nocardioides sp.]